MSIALSIEVTWTHYSMFSNKFINFIYKYHANYLSLYS
uniref:Uncharacterized protein n=1 Tax=Triticum urartu TaxID=4572 RepID=A0A8R7R2V7_TRIUA